MRGEAMKRVVIRLEQEENIPLAQMTSLEFFAREGDWQTKVFADKTKEVHAWEIMPEFKEALVKNLPNAKIEIGDSYEIVKRNEFKNRFNFIVLDNPQGIFGEGHTEHFDALEHIPNIVSPEQKAVIIFNLNSNPFNYDHSPDWKVKRENFYGQIDTSSIPPEFFIKHYKAVFKRLGLTVSQMFIEDRNSEYLHYLVSIVEKAS